SWSVTPAAQTIVAASESATSRIVATGRPPAATPGSSGTLTRDALRRGLRAGSSPGRSIFGARFRRRFPQYGHSVTYGLTSELQFLQTTKRSGSLIPSKG